MKLFICLLVLVIGSSVKAKSFNFGNFFLDSRPPAASQPKHFDPLDYSTEVDADVFNSSSDDVFDSDYQNSSSDGLEVSRRNESDFDSTVASSETTASPTVTTTSESTVTESTVSAVKEEVVLRTTTGVSVSAEEEEVVLGTTTGATAVFIPRTLFQKSIDWVKDAYTLSILLPITAGVLFATTIILVVALCRCLRRCCRRRRFKRKPLPDSVKSLRPEDRARLLGDTSDEEF